MKERSCIIILLSIHFVLKAEKLLLADEVVFDVIPVPRSISSDCGMAIEFPCSEIKRVWRLLASGGVTVARLYKRVTGNEFVELDKIDV